MEEVWSESCQEQPFPKVIALLRPSPTLLITIVDLILCPDLHVSMITIQSRSEKQILNHSHLFEL
jgi:hypothetical protein